MNQVLVNGYMYSYCYWLLVSSWKENSNEHTNNQAGEHEDGKAWTGLVVTNSSICLLYTSDAADE